MADLTLVVQLKQNQSQYSSRSSSNNRWTSGVDQESEDFNSDQQSEINSASSRPVADPDSLDYTVIKFGADYVLRGKLGRYLAAVQTTAPVASVGAKSPAPQSYSLEVSGQGIGEPLDCLNFVNIENKSDSLPFNSSVL